MAPVGDTIPNLPLSRNPVSPNIDDLTLSPLDFDFSDGIAPEKKTLAARSLSTVTDPAKRLIILLWKAKPSG